MTQTSSKHENQSVDGNGSKATFVVQIQYRQNASWQGTVQWLDGKKTQHFRSALELVKLIDEATADSLSEEKFRLWNEAICRGRDED